MKIWGVPKRAKIKIFRNEGSHLIYLVNLQHLAERADGQFRAHEALRVLDLDARSILNYPEFEVKT